MKVSYLSIGLLALFSPLTAAWSKEGQSWSTGKKEELSPRASHR